MSRRTERVDELLRRELAALLVRGELRDPRLQPTAAISITAVRVTGDLSEAKVFVDVLSPALDVQRVLAGLRAGAGVIRKKVADRLETKRVPRLAFVYDESIQRGARIVAMLDDLQKSKPPERGIDSTGSGAEKKIEISDSECPASRLDE